jgi:predicted nucleotidyltransferase
MARTRRRYNPDVDSASLEAIARRYAIELLVHFGSTVTGATHAGSDLDIGVLFERTPVPFDDLVALSADLQALQPEREVDVAVINYADPLFLKKITESCVVVYGSEQRLARLKLYAFKRYADHRRFLDLEREYVRRYVAGT